MLSPGAERVRVAGHVDVVIRVRDGVGLRDAGALRTTQRPSVSEAHTARTPGAGQCGGEARLVERSPHAVGACALVELAHRDGNREQERREAKHRRAGR